MEPRTTGETPRVESGQEALDAENLIRGRRTRKAHPPEMEVGELNIVPYLDIVTNLVMFLLQASATAVALGEIATKLPATGGGPTGDTTPPPPDQKPPLRLTIVIGEKGYTVAGAEAVLQGAGGGTAEGPTLGKVNNEYDFIGLTKLLVNVKKAFPKETQAFVVPEDQVTYGSIVSTMDAMRENGPDLLFPDVMFAGF
ncbi:MAG: biopolymer transporter ExbD [Deltaproteobacteria bacterium]|nr:biopolymer transporter ExbD [Deltaproteobacteria bacterium]